MKTFFRLIFCAAFATLVGCASQQHDPVVDLSPEDRACTVDAAAYTHILSRHCTASSGADQLLPEYCGNRAQAETFCRLVQNSSNRSRTVQSDGRVRYDANLGMVVGTAGQKCGRVIVTSVTNGAVITVFPESSGGPNPPTCY